MGETRQTIHNKMRKLVLASVEALAGAQSGSRPCTKEKFDRLVAENRRPKHESLGWLTQMDEDSVQPGLAQSGHSSVDNFTVEAPKQPVTMP